MIKRMIIMLSLTAIIFGGVFAFKSFGMKMMLSKMAEMVSAPQSVSTIIAEKQKWKPAFKFVGTLYAKKGTDIASEVRGIVERIFIESGQDVMEGSVLLQLNSKEEMARLQSLKAKANLAKLTLDRDEKQIKVKAISQAKYDADKSKLEDLIAQIKAQEAFLQKKVIVAPFSGRLGIRKVNIGQFLNAGEPIVTLQQLDKLYLDFFVPQKKLSMLRLDQEIILISDAFKNKKFKGKITAIDSKIDEETRNIKVRAIVKNPDKILRPGMFVSAVLYAEKEEEYITLPQTAITFNPYGNVVFVVNKDGVDKNGKEKLVAKTVFVKTGKTRGDQIAILSGINVGDEIVTAGQLKIRNGSLVTINNSVQPSNDKNPSPQDR